LVTELPPKKSTVPAVDVSVRLSVSPLLVIGPPLTSAPTPRIISPATLNDLVSIVVVDRVSEGCAYAPPMTTLEI